MMKLFLCRWFTATLLSTASVGMAATVLFPVVVGDRWGYVNKAGETVINPQFDEVKNFSEGLAPVKIIRWGYVDSAGKIACLLYTSDAADE